jgi:hypothetical protein
MITVLNISNKLALTFDKTTFVKFAANDETHTTVNLGYDNKITDTVV